MTEGAVTLFILTAGVGRCWAVGLAMAGFGSIQEQTVVDEWQRESRALTNCIEPTYPNGMVARRNDVLLGHDVYLQCAIKSSSKWVEYINQS